jgi:hypothetical protein
MNALVAWRLVNHAPTVVPVLSIATLWRDVAYSEQKWAQSGHRTLVSTEIQSSVLTPSSFARHKCLPRAVCWGKGLESASIWPFFLCLLPGQRQ